MIIIHDMKTLPRLVSTALSERLRVMPAVVVTYPQRALSRANYKTLPVMA
jgi:hypothetical protein